MFLDNSLTFQTGGWSTAQAVTTTADGTVVVDITGAGVGNAPTMINGFPAANTAIGADIGLGDGEAIPYLLVQSTATGTGAGTVTISLSAAPDNGSYSAGSYTTIYTSKAITGSTLVAGDYILVPVPPTLFFEEGEALPRFYKVTYTVSGTQTSSFKAGLVLNPASSIIAGQYNNNFAVV